MRFQNPKNIVDSDLLQNSKIRPEFSTFWRVYSTLWVKNGLSIYPKHITPTESGISWRKNKNFIIKEAENIVMWNLRDLDNKAKKLIIDYKK